MICLVCRQAETVVGFTSALVKSGLHYEAIVGAVNAKFGLLNTAIGVR